MSNELVPYADIEKMGQAVSKSGLFGVKTVEQAIALMLIAQAYGKHPAVAAMEYNIINNRPSKKSEAMLASFQEAGGKVRWIELTDKKAEAEFSHPSGGTLALCWTFEMAQKAGLVDKEYSNYKKYPRAMLRSRVVAEGVRAVYPAATGGMLSKEEAEDIVEVQHDPTKSRVEALIDNQVEEAQVEKSDAQKDTPKEEPKSVEEPKNNKKKSTKVSDGTSAPHKQAPIDESKQEAEKGTKIIVGLIDNSLQDDSGGILAVKTAIVDRNGKPTKKWSFLIKDKRYGTFDEPIANKIMECVDSRRMVKIEYTERPGSKPGVILNDIVNFSEATTDDVEIQ